MRIISGSAKGRRLFTPAQDNKSIRPTTDRAREALFSIIGAKVTGARVLDLFAGTGAIGCEALSRGASLVYFIEKATMACRLIRANVGLIPDREGRAVTLQHDLTRGLFPTSCDPGSTKGFDLIFADPPYNTNLSKKIVSILDASPVLSEDVLVIVEETKDIHTPDGLNVLKKDDVRRYGDTQFTFYRPIAPAESPTPPGTGTRA